jgi:hypothetical protein
MPVVDAAAKDDQSRVAAWLYEQPPSASRVRTRNRPEIDVQSLVTSVSAEAAEAAPIILAFIGTKT